MIKIDRPEPQPAVLGTRGLPQTQADCLDYDAAPRRYRKGDLTFSANGKIYGHETVKTALLTAQHKKCCYCERKLRASDYGAVEHFRPKAGFRQDESSPEEKPGYYWLAYDWSNLLVSCSICNTSWKQTFFPLRDPARRARSHKASTAREQPLLIDPAREDPRDHIRFNGDAPYALTDRGQTTIDRLGLRRGDLREVRQTLLSTLTHLRSVVVALGPDAPESQEATAHMQALALRSAEFSAMVADFLAAPFVPAVPAPPPISA
jgi:uncharacterized protein (TIGR02646 family)